MRRWKGALVGRHLRAFLFLPPLNFPDRIGHNLVGFFARKKEASAMRRERGFTLTEMLVVIAVIAVLTAILLPVFSTV